MDVILVTFNFICYLVASEYAVRAVNGNMLYSWKLWTAIALFNAFGGCMLLRQIVEGL